MLPQNSLPTLDVVIPSYNNMANLRRCLLSLSAPRQQYDSARYRLIVCVDGSTDGTQEWLKSTVSGRKNKQDAEAAEALRATNIILRTHTDGKNHGRNATRNLALDVLESRRTVFLDSDMRVQPGFLKAHATAEQELQVGKISYLNAGENLWAAYLQRRGAGKFADRARLPYYYLVTGNSSMPTAAFIEAGGQDANMRTYGGGDTEFAIRLHKQAGLPLYYNVKAEAFSEMEKDLRFALAQMIEFGRINLPYILEKHPAHDELFNLRRMLAPGIKGRLLRFGLYTLPETLPEFFFRPLSGRLRAMLIKTLVAGNIYKGFYQATKKRKAATG